MGQLLVKDENENWVVVAGNDVNKVSKSGDTMTGILNICDPVLEDGVIQDSWGTARLNLSDKNGVRFGTIYPYSQVFDVDEVTQGVRFGVSRTINGTDYSNGFLCGIKQDGSGSIYLYDPDAWLWALGLTVEDTSTISSIATAASDFSIESATFVRWGKLAQINITVERTGTAISSAGNHQVFTLKSGKMPAVATGITANTGNISYGTINTSGVCTLRINSWAKNASQSIRAVFLLP